MKLDRDVPDLVLATELNNRLWGVGGRQPGAAGLQAGDPTNWHVFAGVSTDSYAVNVGSDGLFTGMCSFLGYALFFKEGWIHKLYGTKPADFQLTSTLARGVEQGAWRTLCQVDDTLYYKGVDGVYAYDGSLPVRVSSGLGRGGAQGAVRGGGQGALCDLRSGRRRGLRAAGSTIPPGGYGTGRTACRCGTWPGRTRRPGWRTAPSRCYGAATGRCSRGIRGEWLWRAR